MARVLLSVFCGLQGVGTAAVDMNRTHATNPAWTGHARFHVVWQTVTMVLLAGVEIGLVWGGVVEERLGFSLALLLAAVAAVAFLLAFASRGWFGGAMSDANGIRPLRVRLGGRVREVDMNAVVEVMSLLVLGGIALLYRW